MEKNKIILTEQQLSDKVFESIHDCDGDIFAQIAGLMFGGECHAIDDHYEFFPNENYFEGFGKLIYTMTNGPVVVFKGGLTSPLLMQFFGDEPTHADVVEFAKKMKYSLFFEEEK